MRAAALAIAALSVTHVARADDRPLAEAISVAAADDCLGSGALAEHLATWLGRGELDARIEIVVEVGEGTAAFEILAAGEPRGERRFDRLPSSCPDRRAVVALAIALALDDGILASLSSAEPPPAAEPPPEHPPEEPEPRSATTLGIAIEVEAGILVGLLFDPVLVGGVDARLLLPEGIAIRLGAVVSGVAGGELGSARADVSLAGGRLALCLGRSVAAPLALEGCLGVWTAAVHAGGRGFAEDRAVDLGLVAPSARIEARIEPLPWLALFVAVEGTVSVLRPRLEVLGSGAARDLGDVGLAVTGGGALVLR